jgi:protein involved in polysaccharide export with SLBB domain
MNRLLKLSIAAAVALLGLVPSAAQQLHQEQAVRAYQIAPGDVLVVSVSGQEQLSGRFLVGSDGNLILPVLGKVVAGGLSTEGLTSVLRDRLLSHVVNPQVVVSVVAIVPRRHPLVPLRPINNPAVPSHEILYDSPPVPNALGIPFSKG